MKRILPLVFASALLLTGCSSGSQEPSETSESSTSTTATTSSSTTSTSTTTSETTSTGAPVSEEAVSSEPSPASVVAEEPYVVECLFGTPGPALWSDGTTDFSQDCYDRGTADRGAYQCPGTDAFYDDPADCNSANLGGDPAYDTMYPGGLVPTDPLVALLGRQPSSGERQMYALCLEGSEYVTAENCAPYGL